MCSVITQHFLSALKVVLNETTIQQSNMCAAKYPSNSTGLLFDLDDSAADAEHGFVQLLS